MTRRLAPARRLLQSNRLESKSVRDIGMRRRAFRRTSIALKRSSDRAPPGRLAACGNDFRRPTGRELVMKKLRIVLFGAVLAAAGCGRTPFPVLETQLGGLKGQPAQAVIKKLGAPNETSQIA